MGSTFKYFILYVFVIFVGCQTEITTRVVDQVIIPSHYIVVPDHHFLIQTAIDSSFAGDTIMVRPGKYYENIDFSGKDIVLGSQFLLDNNEELINSTVIDGVQNGRSVVCFKSNESRDCALTGFTLKNGNTDYGGGIYIRNSSPTLEHLNIIDNTAEHTGGGIYMTSDSNPIINSVVVENNVADVGGGISARQSSFTLINARVNGNNVATSGGGIQCTLSKNIIINNTIISNNEVTNSQGGGLYLSSVESILLNNVSITANRAFQGGGVYSSLVNNFEMTNSVISGNISDSQGGGVYSVYGNDKFSSTLIYRNNASTGGGIYSASYDILLKNITLCNNIAKEIGGVYSSGTLTIANSIVWGNFGREIEGNLSPITVLYSDIENGQDSIEVSDINLIQWLDGNIDLRPNFININSGEFGLRPDSPCIDAGTELFVVDGDTVINIAPDEFKGDAPDMGAFEFAE